MMTKTFAWGRAIFCIAMAGLGVQCLLRSNPVPALEPMTTVASLPIIGWVSGLLLIVSAAKAMWRSTAHYGAAGLAALLLAWVVFLHLPALAAAPKNGGEWTGALETLALSGAALALYGILRRASGHARAPDAMADRAAVAGRYIFGLCMPGFGVLHFMYISYVAFVIPGWIPTHVFFAYATGVAHVAAGLGILTGVLGRLAAYCTAAMFGSWVILVHAPRVLAHAQDPNEWTSMLIAVGMCGSALLIAAVLSNIPRPTLSAGVTIPAAPRATANA